MPMEPMPGKQKGGEQQSVATKRAAALQRGQHTGRRLPAAATHTAPTLVPVLVIAVDLLHRRHAGSAARGTTPASLLLQLGAHEGAAGAEGGRHRGLTDCSELPSSHLSTWCACCATLVKGWSGANRNPNHD
jgi:hypothetical protein